MGDNYQLNHTIFAIINQLTRDTLSIDRFATRANTLLPVFNSLFDEIGSTGTDAFS